MDRHKGCSTKEADKALTHIQIFAVLLFFNKTHPTSAPPQTAETTAPETLLRSRTSAITFVRAMLIATTKKEEGKRTRGVVVVSERTGGNGKATCESEWVCVCVCERGCVCL